MALNPPLAGDGTPIRVQNEFLILERKDMEIELKIPTLKSISSKGRVFLSTARIVFVSEKHFSESFKSFDVPLAYMFDEKFNQPIFGANYLSGKTKPLYGVIPGDAEFKIWFNSGGCNKFLKVLSALLDQIRRSPSNGPNETFMRAVFSGQMATNTAYADPNDPSVIFVNQPANSWDQSISQQKPANYYYQNGGQAPPAPAPQSFAPPPQFPPQQPGQAGQYAPPPGGQQQQYAPPPGGQQQQFAPPPQTGPFQGGGVSIGSNQPQQTYNGQTQSAPAPSGGYAPGPAGGYAPGPAGQPQQQQGTQSQQPFLIPQQQPGQQQQPQQGAGYPQFGPPGQQGQQQPPGVPQGPPIPQNVPNQTGNYWGWFGPQLQRNN